MISNLEQSRPQSPEASLGTLVTTDDGSLTLAHPEHGECYHNQAGALTEARCLYVQASGLAAMWSSSDQASVCVLDVGLGLGYNAMATIEAWLGAVPSSANSQAHGGLFLHSLEVQEALVVALSSGAALWQRAWPEEFIRCCQSLRQISAQRWLAQIKHPGGRSHCYWVVDVGDAATVPISRPGGMPSYQYVWQDAFSPEKNPPLWRAEWFRKVAIESAPGCKLLSYSVAGHVREALRNSGWEPQKIPATFSAKRHWLKAIRNHDADGGKV